MTKTTTKTKAATTTASKLSTLFGTTPKPSKTKVEKRRDPVQKEKDEELRDTLDAELPSVLAALAAPRVEEKAVDRQAKLERHKEELEQRQRQYEAVQNDMEDALKMLDSL
ncbi:hypothetical protein BC832DRAFT_539808 [Gaertneriomyces semiglobifer]|nr:hypothetical protein BC832DRAFT_539808 [Gaertneriomyces semiglobifer]